MDTVTSTLQMAMGPGEQRAIHPFFQKELGSTRPVEVSPHEAVNPPPAADVNAFPRNTPSIDAQHAAQHEGAATTAPISDMTQEDASPVIAPNEDLNEGRRKRRKVETKHAAEPENITQSALSSWLGHNAPSQTQPLSSESHPQETGTPQAANSSPENGLSQEEAAQATGPRRKTLKINSNGKLLSSPARNSPPASKKKGGKRGRSRHVESKISVMKYNRNKDMGQLIDDILAGRKIQRPAAEPAPVRPSAVESRPLKPTHPFFVKKPSQKSQISSSGDSTPNTRDSTHQEPSEPTSTPTVEKKRVPGFSIGSSSTFGRRVSKFPELVDPLWPPRDFVHVRDDDALTSNNDVPPLPSSQDQKKSKVAAVRIPDEENSLLVSTKQARKQAERALKSNAKKDPALLRLPNRQVASGLVLQTAMDKQMSWLSSDPLTSFPYPDWSANPAISKLRSALLSSRSAFDRAQYESQLWAHKYAPQTATEVLHAGREVQVLRDWLRLLKITAVDTGKPTKDGTKRANVDKKRKKRRKQTEKLDGFIVSSGDEASEMDNLSGSDDELAGDVTVSKTVVRAGDLAFSLQHGSEKGHLTNAILLSGPSGCGKTAAVYAVAKELDFEVFELNPGTRRSARDMLERVGDMTQNHLVYLLNDNEESSVKGPACDEEGKQNKLIRFFKDPTGKKTKSADSPAQASPKSDAEVKRHREQKQSLILLEEADLLFEEDKQFWTGVHALISQSRRPIVITCNDESLIPIKELSLHAILRLRTLPPELVVDYLLLIAANEGHMLQRQAVEKLHDGTGRDLRRSLMELNFWCQMGVGSEKGGLDWFLPKSPRRADADQSGDQSRVISLNTYEPYMGWYNRDLFLSHSSLDKETEALRNIYHWWGLNVPDAETVAGAHDVELTLAHQWRTASKSSQLDMLTLNADYLEMRSSLDILSSRCSLDMTKDVLDTSTLPLPEGHRSNFVDSWPLLHADLLPEYTSMTEAISTSFGALLGQVFRPHHQGAFEPTHALRLMGKLTEPFRRQQVPPSSVPEFQRIFEAIMRANYTMPQPSSRPALSFENGLSPITEDLAPYVRSIMVFDGRLKEYRDSLSSVLSQEKPGRGEKRMRTTRASRAALEGGDKSSTRKERWFPSDTKYFSVMGTGKPEWQDILYQLGYFHVQPFPDSAGDSSEHVSDDERQGTCSREG
ncbi:hypothetical protein N7474_007722 [Penicillium riverlandense]|uniref:uncharacterized protein n=1 Tax=Penicillium riverlandense TaxID=1903569 RepID=UPI002546E5C7|nr:uncharacterized protein N7474_007722 [Penicillium riverlandense]KAJ5811421.1 hypothetical protein N7474_007722 [Penicillium riverlandense]